MRHNKKFNHLGRTSPHRKAMLANMASSLIQHKRISTTVAKAKALRMYVEPLITKAREDTTHSRRMVFRRLQDKDAVSELFREIAGKIGDRPGGYTRILKTGNRLGDNADMCIIELVDYNETMLASPEETKKTKRRRSRRGISGKKAETPVAAAKKGPAGKPAPEAGKETETEPEVGVETTVQTGAVEEQVQEVPGTDETVADTDEETKEVPEVEETVADAEEETGDGSDVTEEKVSDVTEPSPEDTADSTEIQDEDVSEEQDKEDNEKEPGK